MWRMATRLDNTGLKEVELSLMQHDGNSATFNITMPTNGYILSWDAWNIDH